MCCLRRGLCDAVCLSLASQAQLHLLLTFKICMNPRCDHLICVCCMGGTLLSVPSSPWVQQLDPLILHPLCSHLAPHTGSGCAPHRSQGSVGTRTREALCENAVLSTRAPALLCGLSCRRPRSHCRVLWPGACVPAHTSFKGRRAGGTEKRALGEGHEDVQPMPLSVFP